MSPQDESESSRPWMNPYQRILGNFPGRLFTLSDSQCDIEAIRNIINQHQFAICEFGSGSGKHAIGLAKENPEAAVIGFELRFKRSVRTIQKADKEDLRNVYVLRTKAEQFPEIFPKKSLDAVYVNFPDPWAKKRQRKHRLLSENFFNTLAEFMKDHGVFYFKTDHQEYFESVLEILKDNKAFELDAHTHDLYQSEHLPGNIDTEFENLFYHQGLPIHYLRAKLR
jgi:tRNA (guanine-N7-)-methyltransferase